MVRAIVPCVGGFGPLPTINSPNLSALLSLIFSESISQCSSPSPHTEILGLTFAFAEWQLRPQRVSNSNCRRIFGHTERTSRKPGPRMRPILPLFHRQMSPPVRHQLATPYRRNAIWWVGDETGGWRRACQALYARFWCRLLRYGTIWMGPRRLRSSSSFSFQKYSNKIILEAVVQVKEWDVDEPNKQRRNCCPIFLIKGQEWDTALGQWGRDQDQVLWKFSYGLDIFRMQYTNSMKTLQHFSIKTLQPVRLSLKLKFVLNLYF